MSFILDALKKSESDRQRQGGPALFEVKVAPPRHALPPWAVAIALLFVANLAVVAWLLVRHAAAPAQAPLRAQTGPTPPAAAAAALPAVIATNPPAAAAAAPVVPPAARSPAPAAAVVEAEPRANPDDFAPAAEPSPSGSLGRVKRASGVPLYQQLAAAPGTQLPQLRLDLHAYAERAGDRWVLINMHKLHEGDALEGVHVERITPEGAILSYRGSQFLLTQ